MTIRKTLDLALERVIREHPAEIFRDPEVYANWLAQTWYFVRHSTPLLGFALPHLRDEQLRQVFEHHLGEESRHDMLALKDLEKLSHTPQNFSESPWTQAFYQSQYYRIQFQGGESLLGYILLLEGLAITWGKLILNEVGALHKGSTLFLKVHAEEDITHLSRAISLIESLSRADQEKIMANFQYSEALYSLILREIRVSPQRKVA